MHRYAERLDIDKCSEVSCCLENICLGTEENELSEGSKNIKKLKTLGGSQMEGGSICSLCLSRCAGQALLGRRRVVPQGLLASLQLAFRISCRRRPHCGIGKIDARSVERLRKNAFHMPRSCPSERNRPAGDPQDRPRPPVAAAILATVLR